MIEFNAKSEEKIFVGIDIAKSKNDVFIEMPDGKTKYIILKNTKAEFQKFSDYLKSLNLTCFIGFEATGNYHRPLSYFLSTQGFKLRLISSATAAKTREALYNSWDKNDRKDAKVIVHLLKTGLTQVYCEPFLCNFNEHQEIFNTYNQISLRKVKIQHSIMTHYLPLYFPEVEKYFQASRALWFMSVLERFPCPAAVIKYSQDEFIEAAWDISGRKVNKRNWLIDFYETAKTSIGLPVVEESQAMQMFRIILKEHIELCRIRANIEDNAQLFLKDNLDFQRLQTVPGIGPILALSILAQAGNLRRFNHYRQFLKFCGYDLSTKQSGCFRGQSKLSKRGNATLRKTFWMAATVAIRMRENTFRKKFSRYVKEDPNNADLKRKGYTAVAAKMARVVYSIIKYNQDYRCLYDNNQSTQVE